MKSFWKRFLKNLLGVILLWGGAAVFIGILILFVHLLRNLSPTSVIIALAIFFVLFLTWIVTYIEGVER